MKQKLILLLVLILITGSVIFLALNNGNKNENQIKSEDTSGLISVLVDGVEQSAFPSKGSAEYQSTSCTNGETAVWDATNWKLSIQDISASTRCVVSFVTGGHNVYVTVSGGTVDNAPKQVNHNGNTTFTVASSNSNYVFSSVKCTGVNSYSWANNVLSVNGVTADAYCDVVFSRPTYTVYFNVEGGYTANNYVTVVRGGGNSTTFGAIAGYLTSGATITCDPGIEGRLAGTRIVVSNVMSSGDCNIVCSRDTSNYLPGGAVYNKGNEVSYANLAWLVVGSDAESVTLILKANASYTGTSGSNPTGTGIYGSGVVFTSSSARSYLQDIWLEQDAQKYLKSAIDSGGLIYQTDANGYVRLPYAAEVDTNLPNASNTNFWTMDNDGANHVYYGQPSGYLTNGKATDNKYYFEHYTLASNTSVNYSTSSGTGTAVLAGTYYQSYGTCSSLAKTNPTISATWTSATASNNINPVSGASYNPGSYSAGYRRWIKNVASTETNSSTATKNTTLTYSNTTTGNSGMTTAVQAVAPTASSARINDSVPTNSGNQTLTLNVTAGTAETSQYYSTTCANSILCNDGRGAECHATAGPIRGSNYHSLGYTGCSWIDMSCAGVFNGYGCANTCTNSYSNATGTITSRTYVRYTLQAYNTSTMGYRPVIVVKKAN